MIGKVSLGSIFSFKLFGGLLLGWGIGANDSANIFGTAVATNSVRFRTAIWLIAIFVVLGSSCQGWKLYKNYNFVKKTQSEKEQGKEPVEDRAQKAEQFTNALLSTLAAGIVILVATVLALPSSTSQAAVGACIGLAMASGGGFEAIKWDTFLKMLMCWVLNPFAAAICAVVLFHLFRTVLRRVYGKNLAELNHVYSLLLIVAGCYGAYELGANNVVVTTGPYYHAGVFGPPITGDLFETTGFWQNPAFWASTLGGLSIALGALTYSKKVMYTVGSGITVLDPFSAMITVFAHSVCLMVFTHLHVPVSSSQAIVGGVVGIGLVSESKTVSYRTLIFIFIGWLSTPVLGAIVGYLLKIGFSSFTG